MSPPPCRPLPTTSRRSSGKRSLCVPELGGCFCSTDLSSGLVSSGSRTQRLWTATSPHRLQRAWLTWRSAGFPTFPSSNWNQSLRARRLRWPSCLLPGAKVTLLLGAESSCDCACSHWMCVCVYLASAVKQEVKAEPTPQDQPSCSNTELVTIAIRVNPVAAQVSVLSSRAAPSVFPLFADATLCFAEHRGYDGGGGPAAAGARPSGLSAQSDHWPGPGPSGPPGRCPWAPPSGTKHRWY